MDKVHCVWMADGELNVLFECREVLITAHLEDITNKEVVLEYLAKTEYIPHIQTTITMEPTVGLQTHIKI